MNVHVRKWGNSAAVRIPAQTLAAAGIKTDDRVKVSEEDGRIVIEKAEPGEPITLEWLLQGMTQDHLHEEIDFGPPVGKEFR
ncbi:MAG TPA: AbrB/MazE/SpoVT family DNA-binding domain-containing protein [Allosphingosinicella sp.]|uniref:AbrB/MazE/SpoVT family DNA-binding domain-containing protein n=1 Tax=Allosphingosinicella sp. TaxID=2823234 RepID=UPI002F27E270